MSVQKRNDEMVDLLKVDFIHKDDTIHVAKYIVGGTAPGDDLTIISSSNATKGNINFGNSTYDEVNNRLGIGVTPGYSLDVAGRSRIRSEGGITAGFWLSDDTPTDRAFIGLNADGATPMVGIYNGGNWRLYIDDSGDVSIDTTPNGSYKLYINGSLQCTQLGETWIGLTFNTGWGNFGGGWQNGQYKKFGDLVYLRGVVSRTSGVATLITTLPAGYRPPATLLYAVDASGALGRIDITTGGDVVLATGAVTYAQLNGIVFSVL